MERSANNIIHNIDWISVILYVALSTIGILSIYSVGYDSLHENHSVFSPNTENGKQLIWFSTSLVVMMICFIIPQRLYEKYAGIFYLLTLIALILVFIFGKKIGGATSWFSFFGISLQPSEFAKVGTGLALAKLVSDPAKGLKPKRTFLYATVSILLPVIAILLQPDLGSAVVFLLFFYVLYLSGVLGFSFIILILAGVIFMLNIALGLSFMYPASLVCGLLYILALRKRRKILSLIPHAFILTVILLSYNFCVGYAYDHLFKPHHRTRINILLGKIDDPKGVGYNLQQSMIAIGSGGSFGKGYLSGTQTKGEFVPEQSTDFIFCTIGEEFGFVGGTLVIILFGALILRIFFTAQRQRSVFTETFGYSLGCILLIHFGINIAMTMGLGPVIGIPLPFISYGGSSMISFSLMLAIYLSLDARRLSVL